MSIIDDWAEKHILQAIEKDELDNLSGQGKPLTIDDDSHVPPQLKAAYRILKNSGFLPAELEDRKRALELVDLLETVEEDSEEFTLKARELEKLELKMKLAGINTNFLQSKYKTKLVRALITVK
ncbi:DnaJ family domain-containing protein [Entomomonas asaccharolytica]|uniref:DUF1992 domain-containing protein n=1 Tax=Entomomonas asaccharolytica TaxID=2785331 RepID=A0A974NDD5_9GAMM|nr:DnaJ family domain-containing protein [Entomomonas asaccharolytica]QQP84444.1 DUF1992 domain-containing protein [Entomomonas asaccharolytica]